APASWPKSSESSRLSLIAAQLSFRKGWPQRSERKCKRAAISSLPLPRSPTIRTGLLSGATRDTCSCTSRRAADSPIMRSLRSACISHLHQCDGEFNHLLVCYTTLAADGFRANILFSPYKSAAYHLKNNPGTPLAIWRA